MIAFNDIFKAKIIHLAPILASLLFGMLCASILLTSTMEANTITLFPESILGSIGNASYFVVLSGLGASILYLLVKRRNYKLITLITGFAFTTATFMLSFIYLSAAFSRLYVSYIEVFILFLSLLITILTSLAFFRVQNKALTLIVLCLGGALGSFLGASIPTLSVVLILCSLAFYDVFAVYHGPVGKIASDGLERLHGVSFSFKTIQMGLGDLTFYSMLSSHMLLNFGIIPSIASIAGILLGCLLAFKMLERKGIFPGLPFPIFFGLTAFLLTVPPQI